MRDYVVRIQINAAEIMGDGGDMDIENERRRWRPDLLDAPSEGRRMGEAGQVVVTAGSDDLEYEMTDADGCRVRVVAGVGIGGFIAP